MRVHQKTNDVMRFVEFLKKSREDLQQASVIVLVAPEYPLLCVQRIVHFLAQKLARPVRFLDLSVFSFDQICAQCTMSFLGKEFVFCLGDVDVLRGAERAKLLDYIVSYNGPHTVIFFSTQAVDGVFTLNVPLQIQERDMRDLHVLCGEDHVARASMLCRPIGTCSLEQAIRLIDYGSVLGSQRTAFLTYWLPHLVRSETSLFQLSGALFAGDVHAFGQQWHALTEVYDFPFWLVYFSEQFFRAYFFIKYKRAGAHELAKKISYRLPFSFIQRDYKCYEPPIFLRAHKELRALDAHLKTGGDPLALERVFALFTNVAVGRVCNSDSMFGTQWT